MAKQAVVVKYRVKPGQMASFLSVLRSHIEKTRATEPGCIQFDILMPHEGEDTVRLYEVYANEEAFRIHNASAQLVKYRNESTPLLHEREIIWCTVAD